MKQREVMAIKWKRKRSLWVAGLTVDRANRILLTRKRGPVADSWTDWMLPRGYVKTDELPNEAILRVMKEQAGLIVDIVRSDMPRAPSDNVTWIPLPFCLYDERAGEGVSRIVFTYRCSIRSYVHPKPETDAQWFDLVEVDKLRLEPCTRAIYKMICTTPESTTPESTTTESTTTESTTTETVPLSDLPSPYRYP